jgi:hypothetical protein
MGFYSSILAAPPREDPQMNHRFALAAALAAAFSAAAIAGPSTPSRAR